MQTRRHRLALLAVLCLALSVVLGLALADLASAKKKGGSGGTVNITRQVNQQVPDATPTQNGLLASTISVGKKFKGRVIRDVNVTLQTTGSAPDSAGQLSARLTAPNGATTWLIGSQLSGQSIGPLTLDDETPNRLGGIDQRDPTTLVSPYIGTAQPDCFDSFGVCTFWPMDGGPVRGTWTLTVYDTVQAGPSTSVLNSWRLNVVAGKPFLTK